MSASVKARKTESQTSAKSGDPQLKIRLVEVERRVVRLLVVSSCIAWQMRVAVLADQESSILENRRLNPALGQSS